MSRGNEENEVFKSSHMTLLLCFTVFAVILIGESILLGWERWALVLVVAGLIGAWIMHIQQLLADGLGKSGEEISKSGNIVVDSLVNYKYSIAKKEGIAFEVSVFVPSVLPFKSEHLVIILGNLLENAFDACMKVQPKGRFIRLDMSFEKNMLKIGGSILLQLAR